MRSFNAGILVILLLAVTACSTHKPMPAVEYVDLDRFMGDWFVIANIPTFLEKIIVPFLIYILTHHEEKTYCSIFWDSIL